MKINRLAIPDVIEIVPTYHKDGRGCFFETFNFNDVPFLDGVHFVQFMESHSHKGVVRGLHFQDDPYGQAKLVRVTRGSVFDVAVDVRVGSPTYSAWVGVELSDRNNKSLFIPSGFAHGFMVLEDDTRFTYGVDAHWNKDSERCLKWDDDEIGIEWPEMNCHNISDKDKEGSSFKDLKTSFKY